MAEMASPVKERFSSLQHSVKKVLPWERVKKVLTWVFFIAIAALLVSKGSELDWAKIWDTFTQTSPVKLAIATGLGLLCYSAYASYDLIGRYLLRLNVSAAKAWLAAWISYACNLNLGALVGSVAFRYRLYSRLGVKSGDVTRIIGVSVLSNWLGYLLLAGGLFVSGAFEPPESWWLNQTGVVLLGIAFLAVVATYIGFCAFSKKREYHIRSTEIILPSARVTLWQFATAAIHWSLMAAVMHQFFAGELSYFTVYAVLLISCVAGAVSHVPGGLGVVEAVFIALLAGQLERHQIIAGVFAYRCVFYLVPLLIALPTYFIFETVLGNKEEHKDKA